MTAAADIARRAARSLVAHPAAFAWFLLAALAVPWTCAVLTGPLVVLGFRTVDPARVPLHAGPLDGMARAVAIGVLGAVAIALAGLFLLLPAFVAAPFVALMLRGLAFDPRPLGLLWRDLTASAHARGTGATIAATAPAIVLFASWVLYPWLGAFMTPFAFAAWHEISLAPPPGGAPHTP